MEHFIFIFTYTLTIRLKLYSISDENSSLTGLQCKVEHILVPVQAWNVLSPFFYELVTIKDTMQFHDFFLSHVLLY